MVAKYQYAVLSNVPHNAIPFAVVDGRFFVVMKTDRVIKTHGSLRQRENSFFQGGYRHAGARVCVDHAAEVGACAVNCAVERETSAVDLELPKLAFGLVYHIAVEIKSVKNRRP